MKNSKVHTHEVRSNAAALPVTEAFVRFQITGICGVVLNSGHAPLLTIIPDGRRPRFSVTDPSAEIPPHHAFVMFPAAAASGREADFNVKNGELGVCLLEQELITLAGGTIEPLAPPQGSTTTEIVNLSRVCGHAKAAKSCVAFPPREGVLAQVSLPSDQLWVQTPSDDDYSFEPACTLIGDPQNGKLAEVAAVDFRISDASTLMLESHAFGGGPSHEALVLSLQGTTAKSPLVITIGNTPLPDLQRYVDESPGGHQHDRDVHFELYYTLAAANQLMLPTIPVRQLTKVPHASNCPPAIMDVEE
jgi:hypothetical protein